MYVLDQSVGMRWLDALRRSAAANLVADIVSIRPAFREAEDGSTELWAIVVLKDGFSALPRAQRKTRLASLEQHVKSAMLGDGIEHAAGPRLVSFRTEAEDSAQVRRHA